MEQEQSRNDKGVLWTEDKWMDKGNLVKDCSDRDGLYLTIHAGPIILCSVMGRGYHTMLWCLWDQLLPIPIKSFYQYGHCDKYLRP